MVAQSRRVKPTGGEEEFHMRWGAGGGGDLLGGWGPCGMRGCPHWKVALCVMSRVS